MTGFVTQSMVLPPHGRPTPGSLGWLVAVGVVLIVLSTVGEPLHRQFGGFAHWAVIAVMAAGAAWAALGNDHIDPRRALWVIGLAAIAMRLPMLLREPYLSDDIYRYIWDGRVQAAGINPYRYIPRAPELAHLRDSTIYPLINRANYAPTIYPPVAQMFFLMVTRLGESVLVMKFGLLVLEGVAIGATWIVLRRLSLQPARIAAFAWHPLPVWEIASGGHVDAVMIGLLAVALVLMLDRRLLLAGAVATAAALVKPLALLLLPVMWRPWNWRLPAVVVITIAALYLPYLSVGTKVLGFLPTYVQEEELTHGTGFRYLMALERWHGPLPAWSAMAYAAGAGVILLALALAVGFRRDRSDLASVRSAAVLMTAFLVLLTPHYPWYYIALMPFVAIYPKSATLWLLTAGGLHTYQAISGDILPDFYLRQIVFHSLVLAAVAFDVWLWRAGRASSPPPIQSSAAPESLVPVSPTAGNPA